jgi:integrase
MARPSKAQNPNIAKESTDSISAAPIYLQQGQSLGEGCDQTVTNQSIGFQTPPKRNAPIPTRRLVRLTVAAEYLSLSPWKMRRLIQEGRLAHYVDSRQQERASNATINREVAALKRMFRLGQQSTPAKVIRMPYFPHLRENNVRKGFLEDSQYLALVKGADLWFRTLVECGRTFGWRVSELVGMKVNQVDLMQRVIRLAPGTTKNSEGREVFMTDALHLLLTACVQGKGPEDAVFTRPNGVPVRSFREAWERACCKAGVGQFNCADCNALSLSGNNCPQCSGDRMKYTGLIFHDLRRTAARNLRRAGISETVIMKIGGWRTRSVFERYAIVSRGDMVDAMQKLQRCEDESQKSHVIGNVTSTNASAIPPSRVN